MARIFKTGGQCRFDDAVLAFTETLLGVLNSLQQYVAMRRVTRALPEQLGKVVGAHTSNIGKLRPLADFGPHAMSDLSPECASKAEVRQPLWIHGSRLS
jgi:hypothetical protein